MVSAFEVAQSETLAIVGESGSGKSTCALAFMRPLPRTATMSGSIALNGRYRESGFRRGDAAGSWL